MKAAQAHCGPILFGFLACGIGTVPGVVWYAVRRHMPLIPPASFLFISGVIGVGLFEAFAQSALALSGAGKTVLLVYSMPFWATAIAWWRLGEIPNRNQKLGLILAGIGVIWVAAPWHTISIAGSAMALASGLCWGAGSVATRELLTRQPEHTPLSLSTWQLAIGSIPLFFLWTVSGEGWLTPTAGTLGALAYSAILCGVPAWALWGLIVKRLPIVGAGLTSLLIPVAGVGFAWIFLKEQPDANELAGMAVILLALGISTIPNKCAVEHNDGEGRQAIDSDARL